MPPKRPSQTTPTDMFSPDSLGEDFAQKRGRASVKVPKTVKGSEDVPITAGSPLARNLRLSSSDLFTTPISAHPTNRGGSRRGTQYQEGQGDSNNTDMGTPTGMSFSVANTQPRRAAVPTTTQEDERSQSTVDTQLTVDATPDQSQLQYFDGPSTSVRSGTAPSQSTQQQPVDGDEANTPLVSQVSSSSAPSSAYGNMCVDNPHLESQAQRLEVLLSQATTQHTTTTTLASSPVNEDVPTTPDAALCLPHPRRHIVPPTTTAGVLTQRDPNTTPLHVQLARVAEPQTCSQGAVGHAEAVQDFLVRYGDGEDEEDGRALFASPMQAAADTIAALADTPEPTLRRGRGVVTSRGEEGDDIVVTQLEGSVERGVVVGNKRARAPSSSSKGPTTARTVSPEPISTTQRQRHEGAEWSRLARQFFEFIDSRPDLSTIEKTSSTTHTITSNGGRNKQQH